MPCKVIKVIKVCVHSNHHSCMLLMFMLQMYNFYFILTNILTENLHGNLLFATCPNLYNLFEGMHIKKYTVL